MKTIVVSGVIANKHRLGGAIWTRLSWIHGFRKLGFKVVFIEQIDPNSCVDEKGEPTTFESSANLRCFRSVSERFGLAGWSSLMYGDGEKVEGIGCDDLLEIAASAELLVNITGHLTHQPLLRRFRKKAYIDLDPGYTQLWHAAGSTAARLEQHDFFFTVGHNIGTDDCGIPTGNVDWLPVRQPVVLEHWPVSSAQKPYRFTTVASWRGPYGRVEHQGKLLGLKAHQFRHYIDLPRRVGMPMEVALDIHASEKSDLELLRENGWRVVDPTVVAGDPDTFRSYVQNSAAEFSVAQGIYVETNSGWFSDRTVRYLASGKPALVQDTGFSRDLPVGNGLIAFRTPDEAADGAQIILNDLAGHGRAARAIAEQYFDSDKVLSHLLRQTGIAA